MSLYELFFQMELNISDRFPALTPIKIRKTKATEIFLLLRRLTKHNQREQKDAAAYTSKTSGKKIIRRKAGDNWF